MSRLDGLLVVAVLGCALGLVQSQHRAREQFAALETLKTEARTLDETYSSLSIEQSTWADPARIDAVAQQHLGLVAPTPARMAVLEAQPRLQLEPVGGPIAQAQTRLLPQGADR